MLVILALPWLGLSPVWQIQITLIAILSLLVGGLNLSMGFGGELALAQVAMYAAGAYITGYFALHGVNDLGVNLLVSMAAAAIIGLIISLAGIRMGGWSLAMTSFFLVLLVPDLAQIFSGATGGLDGLSGVPSPEVFGFVLTTNEFYLVVIIVAALWFAFMRNLIVSRHGVALHVLRESPILTGSLGISVNHMKMKAYIFGAIPCGAAGCLYMYAERYVDPTTFSFTLSVTILVASIIGGARSIYGALVGATIVQITNYETTANLAQYTSLFYGALLVIGGVFLGGGVAMLARKMMRNVNLGAVPDIERVSIDGAITGLPGADLIIDDVTKRFGTICAVDGVSIRAPAGEITAVIGPNGSGKTTLFNLVSGFYRLDQGTIRIGEKDISGRRPHQVARAGVARTFQTPVIPESTSVRESVSAGLIGPQYVSVLATVLRLRSFRERRAADAVEVDRALRFVGLEDVADRDASSLNLASRRLLELARAVVGRPAVLLLDEVASGLDEDEIVRLAQLIRDVRAANGTVVLVEHNFSLVLELADRIHVLAQGSVIATGTPSEIEKDAQVLSQYLGVGEPMETPVTTE